MSTSGSKSNEHVAHFLVDIHSVSVIFARRCRQTGNKAVQADGQ